MHSLTTFHYMGESPPPASVRIDLAQIEAIDKLASNHNGIKLTRSAMIRILLQFALDHFQGRELVKTEREDLIKMHLDMREMRKELDTLLERKEKRAQ